MFQPVSTYHGTAKSPRHVMVESAMWRVCVSSSRDSVEGQGTAVAAEGLPGAGVQCECAIRSTSNLLLI